jgi:3-oxoacyl-[acyl-carrier protein] reductase
MMSNDKQVVIVTGGSRGLGLALISGLLTEGYRVATCSREKTVEIDKLESSHKATGEFLWTASEMGIEKEEQAFFDHVVSWAGKDEIYGLVNNAAITGEGILATFPNVDSERIIAVNLLSALRLSRLALRVMLRHGTVGRIVNISSIVGLRGYTGLAAYSVSKAGMDGLTRSLAREVGRRGITVNSVAPGATWKLSSLVLGKHSANRSLIEPPSAGLGQWPTLPH